MMKLLVAVGSPREKICSIGAFARAEAEAGKKFFERVDLLVPSVEGRYPITKGLNKPDVIFYHAPALHDRKKPWNALLHLIRLRRAFPHALLVSIVHELSEAPKHWQLRQLLLLKLSHAAIVNTAGDFLRAKRWQSKILRSRLGPTLSVANLHSTSVEKLGAFWQHSRQAIAKQYSLPYGSKWILNPGLVTPGKGVDRLAYVAEKIPGAHFIVIGGIGPKRKDRIFATQVIQSLNQRLGKSFTFIEAPDDSTFVQFLVSADLVFLPYDVGISERRSSFLSAASCGANVWTTVGRFSEPLELQRSGAHFIDAQDWNLFKPTAVRSIQESLLESQGSQLERRLKNLTWAQRFSWENRFHEILQFLQTIS